ncbi:fibronectin type III domain-containing protein [Amnibacterium sp. CER49]|uniref:fibronectin type III domain-containing protein n=1 Tax=Amnibacterium sp. CER49 TaxID=3039161 RepID=UPI0024485212|nr:fibronectin type III domain-containing protein [Amnibacterium sp. CER49]MDH2445145.1 fibronectin type III domain-containing protein [Amnibacterium sp. CER49]
MKSPLPLIVGAVLTAPIALLTAAPAHAALPAQTLYLDPSTACSYDSSEGRDVCRANDYAQLSPGTPVTVASSDGSTWLEVHFGQVHVVSTTIAGFGGTSQTIPNAAINSDSSAITTTLPKAMNYDVEQDGMDQGLNVRIDTYDAYGRPANVIEFHGTFATQPEAPSAVTGRRSNSTSATISWQPPANSSLNSYAPVTKYIVKRTNSTGSWSTTLSSSTRSFTFSSLTAGAGYTLAVQAVNAVGSSPLSQISIPGSSSSLYAPSALTVERTAQGSATVKWSPPTVLGGKTITGYRVARDGLDTSGHTYSHVVAASVRSITLTYLVLGRTYNLSVQPVYGSTSYGPIAKAGAYIG